MVRQRDQGCRTVGSPAHAKGSRRKWSKRLSLGLFVYVATFFFFSFLFVFVFSSGKFISSCAS